MTPNGLLPKAEMGALSPLERFRSIREAATIAEEASADLDTFGLDDPALEAALEAFDAACGTLIDLICDPASAEMMAEIDAFLEVTYGRAG